MKKTITSALLTLALVGFANAAPPVPQPPQDIIKVSSAYIFNLKRELVNLSAEARQTQAENVGYRNALIAARKQVETLKKENKVLDDKVLAFEGAEIVAREVGSPPKVDTPKVDTPKAKPVKELTRRQKRKALRDNRSAVSIKLEMAAAYTKEFDSNKDGGVSVSERPDRNDYAAFLKKMHKKNYPHLYREDGTRTNQPVKKSK